MVWLGIVIVMIMPLRLHVTNLASLRLVAGKAWRHDGHGIPALTSFVACIVQRTRLHDQH